MPTSLVEGLSFERSYSFLDEWVIEALPTSASTPTSCRSTTSRATQGKIGGAAQKRFAAAPCCTT